MLVSESFIRLSKILMVWWDKTEHSIVIEATKIFCYPIKPKFG